MNAPELQKLKDWLIDGGRSSPVATHMMSEMCERLIAAGVPLWRVGIFIHTLHPDIFGRNFIWKPGEPSHHRHGGLHHPRFAGVQ